MVKILQSLNIAKIIETKEGKQGGIRLIKDPNEITILEILEATEKGKPLFQTTVNIMADGKRPNKAQNSIKTILTNAENQMKLELSRKTIGQILVEMND